MKSVKGQAFEDKCKETKQVYGETPGTGIIKVKIILTVGKTARLIKCGLGRLKGRSLGPIPDSGLWS